jgi:hypothetical protein
VVHIYIVVVHKLEDEFVLFRGLRNFSDTIAITVFLNLDTVHLHLEGVVHVSDVIPRSFNCRCVDKVEFLVHIESTMVNPIMIVTVISKFGSEAIGGRHIRGMLIRKHDRARSNMRLYEIYQICVFFIRDIVDHWDFRSSANHSKHPTTFWPLIRKQPKSFGTNLGFINFNWSR